MKNKYMPTAIALYINYFVHGMGVIILAQNMNFLAKQWGTSTGAVAMVVSSLGIGRIINLLISGILSDKFGRKPFILLGITTYLIFFIGIVFSPNVTIAYILGILAGMANSFLDSGTYPALMEIYPNAKGTSNVVLKAFISGGQFLLPLIVSALISSHNWYGWSFMLPAAILIVIFIFMLYFSHFPDTEKVAVQDEKADQITSKINDTDEVKSKLWIDGVLFIIYGYVSQATFYLISQWLSQYGQQIGSLNPTAAHALISYYSIGSIVCVILTAILGKKFSEIQFLPVYTLISFISIVLIWLYPTNSGMLSILSFIVGFSAAGGVMQLGLTVMAKFFPAGKGTITGFFYTAGSIASFTIPLVTGMMTNLKNVMFFDVIIALIGFVVTSLIAFRYKKLFGNLSK